MTRKQFIKIIGPLPKKIKLKPLILELADCGNYIKEKIEYYVEANEKVRAYLLRPKNRQTKTPAIFCHHQHASNYKLGKSEMVGLAGNPNLAYAKELAERGYIAFAPDAVAFEERNWHDNSWWGTEYFELASRLLKGQTLLAKVLHDISVGINYLSERPEVDGKKIGFIGHSYGGRMALIAPAFDKRIKVAVSNCYCLNLKTSLNKAAAVRIPMEFCVPNILKHGDIEDIIKLAEPASLYISAATDDKWSQDAKKIYNYAKPAFLKGELKLKIWRGNHVFSKQMRQSAYQFLDKYLCVQ